MNFRPLYSKRKSLTRLERSSSGGVAEQGCPAASQAVNTAGQREWVFPRRFSRAGHARFVPYDVTQTVQMRGRVMEFCSQTLVNGVDATVREHRHSNRGICNVVDKRAPKTFVLQTSLMHTSGKRGCSQNCWLRGRS